MQSNDSSKVEIFDAIARGRHSCRAFMPEALPAEKIERLLELAQRAPSDCNTQPWTTYLVEGAQLEKLRAALYERVTTGAELQHDVAPIEKYEGVLLERRRACGWGLYEAVGITKGDRDASRVQALENFRFFGAPHVAVITADASLAERGLFDAGIYMGYFLLAAEALGIGAVPQAAISHHAGYLREELGIAPNHRIVSVVSFGRKDENHPANSFRTSRASLDEAVVFHQG